MNKISLITLIVFSILSFAACGQFAEQIGSYEYETGNICKDDVDFSKMIVDSIKNVDLVDTRTEQSLISDNLFAFIQRITEDESEEKTLIISTNDNRALSIHLGFDFEELNALEIGSTERINASGQLLAVKNEVIFDSLDDCFQKKEGDTFGLVEDCEDFFEVYSSEYIFQVHGQSEAMRLSEHDFSIELLLILRDPNIDPHDSDSVIERFELSSLNHFPYKI